MKPDRSILFSIFCVAGGAFLLTFAKASIGTNYPNGYCASMGPACGTYTQCAQFIGFCTDPTTNKTYSYKGVKNQNRKGGFCTSTGGTGCTMSAFQCYTSYYSDTACANLVCTVPASNPIICP